MNGFFKSIFPAAIALVLLAFYLVLETLATMILYMYLALNHVETFGQLIGFSRNALNIFTNSLEQYSPQLANQAYTTLLGELGPKSILLLLIGLIVSALGRFLFWGMRRVFRQTNRATA